MRVLCLGVVLLSSAAVGADIVWTETFAGGRLDPDRWETTSSGDFRDRSVSVVEVPDGTGRFRLALSADTRGTRDDTVKTLGVRSVPRFELPGETRVSLRLDWNGQSNGSYLSAAVVLSPHETSADVLTRPDWFKVEYVGVAPGKNARMVIGVRRGGQERTLSTEGWPEHNRSGRPIGLQRLTIVLRDGRVQVMENDAEVYSSNEKIIQFGDAHLYLRMSSHSNYPPRTIHVESIRVERTDGL